MTLGFGFGKRSVKNPSFQIYTSSPAATVFSTRVHIQFLEYRFECSKPDTDNHHKGNLHNIRFSLTLSRSVVAKSFPRGLGASKQATNNTHCDTLLSRSWCGISINVSRHTECLAHNQTVMVTNQHKMLRRPRHLLNPVSNSEISHSQQPYGSMSDSHVSE